MPAKIVYHSQTKGGAEFSPVDQEAVVFRREPIWPIDYLVIDARVRGAFSARQYAWNHVWRCYLEVFAYRM